MWSPQQEAALKQVKVWLADKNGPQVFRIFGFAGTGKSTLSRALTEDAKGKVVFACFTGKAALVLTKKGCPASTIHSLIYKPAQDPITGEMSFVLNRDGGASAAELIVLDEVSMVDDELGRDVLSFKKKVLVLGDPFQLPPPTKGQGFFTSAKPDVMLTEIHRQGDGNPIIHLSMLVREGKRLTVGKYGESEVLRRTSIDKAELRDRVLASDQVLVGLNATRQVFNKRIREIKGLISGAEWIPSVGDRLICLRNDREKGIFNGERFDIESVMAPLFKEYRGRGYEYAQIRCKSIDNPTRGMRDFNTMRHYLESREKELDWRDQKLMDALTFGWTLTVHKSQGSQFDSVLVLDESGTFRESAKNHLYTAITRAVDKVEILL